MSKFKFSFSLIFTLFLVGMLSTAAFATGGPYGVKGVYNSTTQGFDVTFNVLDNSQSTAGFKIDMLKKDSTGAYKVDVLNAFATSVDGGGTNYAGLNLGKASILPTDTTAGNFEVGVTYQLVLYASDGTTVLEKEYAVYNDSSNTLLLHDGTPKKDVAGNTITVDPQGTGLVNDNQTGFGNLSKARSGQKVHGFYQNNTNSCASCHQTHTAADGEYLLFKDGIYSTCSACHDGTTGAMNAFEKATSDTPNEIAGTFDVSSGHNGSLHEADGSLNVSAAPGGNRNPDSTNALAAATYGAEFDCASCHAAHGAGSTQENNLNLDPLGWGGVAYSATGTDDQKNGKLFTKVQIVDLTQTGATLPSTESTPYILVKKTLATGDISTKKGDAGYLYSRVSLAAGDTVLQTYRWTGTPVVKNGKTNYGYVPDFSLFLRDVGHVSAPFVNANTAFFDGSTTPVDITKDLNIVWRDGFVYAKQGVASAFDNIQTANISIGIDVETSNNTADLFNTTQDSSKNYLDPNYVYDAGTEMSKYCASCHVDYASVTRGQDTGVYTTAHRHATLQDRLSCVRCHFGHGADAQVMKDANDNTYWTLTQAGGKFDDSINTATQDTAALSYLQDPNPSSALKRYTGMSVCYACHGKGEQFSANPNQKDIPLNGDPGATRTKWTTGQ